MQKKILLAAVILLALCLLAGAALWAANRHHHNTYIQIGDTEYRRDIAVLTLTPEMQISIDTYSQLPQLKQLDARQADISPEYYESLQAALPDCEIQWLLPFQGQRLPLDTKQLTITALTQEELSLLRYLPLLTQIDATGCPDLNILMALKAQFPQCSVQYRVPLGETLLPCDTRILRLSDFSGDALTAALPYLPNVSRVVIEQPLEDPQAMLTLRQSYPHIDFAYNLDIAGQTVSRYADELDLSGIPLGSVDQVEALLPHLTFLKWVDMSDCGIPDDQMDALNRRYPDIQFVWTVVLGGRVRLRTDIIHFMPYQYRYQVTDADADKLKYLTELIVLDFGHMDITRTDYLAYMTKLQYLLMCDAPITDISGCSNMPELKYVELFMTDVTDFSPLLACEKLVDLNICYTNPRDISALKQMTQLENLWFRGNRGYSLAQELREALPDTRIMATKVGSSTGAGWRELENYYNQRDILGMGYMTD